MTKKLSILSISLFISCSFLAQISIDAPITDVTVFLSQAQVTRSAQVQLNKGTNQLVVSGLTSRLNPSSVIVSGSEQFTILGVKHEQVFDQTFQASSPIQIKQDSLDDLQFDLSIKQATEKVYQEELSFIQANRNIKGNEGVLLVEDIQEMADFWRERVKEIQFRQLEIREEQKDIQKSIQRLQQELNKLNSWKNKNQSQITISIDVQKTGKIPIELSYVVYDASWTPTYDIRTKSTSENVQLSYKGKVRQATGNDWSNVSLTLSSGNPAIGGNPPNLNTWYLRNGGSRGDKDKYRKANAPAYGYEMEEDADVMELATTFQGSANLVEVNQNLINTEFNITIPYTIPSDNQYVEVENQKFSLPSHYQHFAVPKYNELAYLLASVTDWMQYNLLPGNANIYFSGTFVGTSYIEASAGQDTLELSLGRDPSVVIKREQLKEFCKTTTLGGKKKTSKAFETTVMNTKNQVVTIKIEDQVPVSQEGNIEVEIEELSGGTIDSETGKVTWNLTIQPGESITRQVRFSVKYPKKTIVSGL